MTLRKIPIVTTPLGFWKTAFHLANLFNNKQAHSKLTHLISSHIDRKHLFFLNSGLSCFFVILEALKKISPKKEVILPAYTAPSLVVAVKKADLKPVLCDISLDDFNSDFALLPGLISQNTLCILGAHMFGIISGGLEDLKVKYSDIFIIEDCAQAMGSSINNIPVGKLGDISFFSFNKGKNIPTFGGGCIATDSEELADIIKSVIGGMSLKQASFFVSCKIALKTLILSMAVKPWVYGMFYSLISRFKESTPPKDLNVGGYTILQAKLALLLLRRIEELSRKRYDNGIRLIEELKDFEGLILPKINKNTKPAFNRLPIVFSDLEKREKVEKNLCKAGIETSRMYLMPLHHHFDLNLSKEELPNSTFFANHLLTLPTHPLLTLKTLKTIINIIKTA